MLLLESKPPTPELRSMLPNVSGVVISILTGMNLHRFHR